MKKNKLLISLILVSFIFLVTPQNIFSQEINDVYNQAYKEYSLAMEEYKKTHDEYLLSRSQYLRYQTLTSQNKAKDSTYAMLQARDDVVAKYLNTLKAKAESEEGIEEATLQTIALRLNEEIAWFSDHKERLPSAGSLDDLVADSDNAQKRYQALKPFTYEVLASISTGKVNSFRGRLDQIFSDTKDKLNKIREEDRDAYKFSSRKIQIIDRWVFETEARIIRSDEKKSEALAKVSELDIKNSQNVKVYNTTLDILGQSQLYLKEASSFVKEIIKEVMTAE